MAEPILEIRGISKSYRIMHMHSYQYKRLSESLTSVVTHPVKTYRQAKKAKERFWALRDVNFKVSKGEALGIIGRNGAGKSTLLKILSQVTRPTEGEVVLRGNVGSLLEVGTGFHPELTGRENIYLNGSILGMSKREIERKFDDIVRFAEVEKFLDTPVKRFSSGMYVRLAFAVAAHLEPEILIVDEVLAVGDAQFQRKCLGKMKDVTEGGRTVLFVSHNMKTISALCERTALLDSGKLVMVGPTSEVTRHYLGMGGAEDEIFHVTSPMLQWIGLINRGELNQKRPEEDLEFVLAMKAGNEFLQDLGVEVELYNENDVLVMQGKQKSLGKGFDLQPQSSARVHFRFISPRLAPGHYHLTVKVGAVFTHLWVERVDACTIVSRFGSGEVPLLSVKSIVVPDYSVDVEQ